MKLPGIPDPRSRRYVSPTRVVCASGPDAPAAVNLPTTATGTQATVFGPPGVRLAAGTSVVFDFGVELVGGVQIVSGTTPGNRPARVRLRFGESVSETLGTPNNDHAIHDTLVELPWYGGQEYGTTAFRFLRLDVPAETEFIELQGIRAVFLYRDLPWLGSFRCSDERLNRIWEVGAYTVFLNMQEYLWDGPKRDRLVWIGDMFPEAAVVSAVFGAADVVPRSLDLVRDEAPPPKWMNSISSYSLWWILIQWEWFRQHGNRDYLRAQHDYLRALVRQLRAFVADDGTCRLPAAMLDHPSSRNPAAVRAGTHGLLRWAFTAATAIAEELGDRELRQACFDAARLLAAQVPDPGLSKPAMAMQVLAGLRPPGVANKTVFTCDPTHEVSPFFGHFILEARALAGDHAGCLESIRTVWGGMLDLGATTFWEHFDPDWLANAAPIDELVPAGRRDVHADCGEFCYTGLRHSLCHGWSAGPTAWLSTHVLGFRPVTPGCATLMVRPHLGGLAWAEGTWPTPAGVVTVRHEQVDDGTIRSTVDAPDGVTVLNHRLGCMGGCKTCPTATAKPGSAKRSSGCSSTGASTPS